jgi:hypothetical protein
MTDTAQATPQDSQPIQEGDYTIQEVATTQSVLATVVGAEIDAQIATAKNFPRSLAVFLKRATSLATISQEVAESCEYGLPRGGKIITGPSVRLAEIIVSSYGNVRAGTRVVQNTGRQIVAQAVCHDLETNVAITIEVTRSIMQHEKVWDNAQRKMIPTGRMVPMNEDMQTLAGNAAASIALRNAIFRVVPKAAWTTVAGAAKKTAMGSEATLPARRTAAMAWFKEKGIKEDQIFRVLEVKGVEDIDLEKLSKLSAIKAAVANNEASLENIFPKDAPADKASKATKSTEDKLNKSGNAVNDTAGKLAADLEKKPDEKK